MWLCAWLSLLRFDDISANKMVSALVKVTSNREKQMQQISLFYLIVMHSMEKKQHRIWKWVSARSGVWDQGRPPHKVMLMQRFDKERRRAVEFFLGEWQEERLLSTSVPSEGLNAVFEEQQGCRCGWSRVGGGDGAETDKRRIRRGWWQNESRVSWSHRAL